MVIDHCESSDHATTCWYQCPVCKQVRLTSEHQSLKDQGVTALRPDDDGAAVNEYEQSYTL